MYKALEGSGYDLEVVQVNYDAAQELAAAEEFIAKGVVGLVIQPNTAESAGAAAAAAKAEGIPTGNCIWPGPSDADQFFDGVAELDSVEGGRLIGEYLKANATPGKIVVVQGVVGQGFSEKIDEGLDEVLAGTDFEVVVREQAFFDRTQAVGVVETAFQAHPDISIIVAYSASMSNGIAQWLKDQGKDRHRPRVVRRRRRDDHLDEDAVPRGHPVLLVGTDRSDRRQRRARRAEGRDARVPHGDRAGDRHVRHHRRHRRGEPVHVHGVQGPGPEHLIRRSVTLPLPVALLVSRGDGCGGSHANIKYTIIRK